MRGNQRNRRKKPSDTPAANLLETRNQRHRREKESSSSAALGRATTAPTDAPRAHRPCGGVRSPSAGERSVALPRASRLRRAVSACGGTHWRGDIVCSRCVRFPRPWGCSGVAPEAGTATLVWFPPLGELTLRLPTVRAPALLLGLRTTDSSSDRAADTSPALGAGGASHWRGPEHDRVVRHRRPSQHASRQTPDSALLSRSRCVRLGDSNSGTPSVDGGRVFTFSGHDALLTAPRHCPRARQRALVIPETARRGGRRPVAPDPTRDQLDDDVAVAIAGGRRPVVRTGAVGCS